MKTYGGVEIKFHTLIVALAGGESSASSSSHFIISPDWIEGWAGPRTSEVDKTAVRKICTLQPIASHFMA
jgi:hypothetical protein